MNAKQLQSDEKMVKQSTMEVWCGRIRGLCKAKMKNHKIVFIPYYIHNANPSISNPYIILPDFERITKLVCAISNI